MYVTDKLICIIQILFFIVAVNVEFIKCDAPGPAPPTNPAPATPANPAPTTPTNPAPATPANPVPATPTNPAPATPANPGPAPPTNPAPAPGKTLQRLPTNVKPVLYNLSFKPDLKNFKFGATEIVTIKILQATDKIILNCLDIEIKSVRLTILSTNEVLQPKFTLSADDEILNLQFTKALPQSDAELTIEYNGILNDQGVGCFRSQYPTLPKNGEKYFFATQFDPADARRCFPCWDEPAIKAEYDITLFVDADKIALSNMPVDKETTLKDGLKEVKFKRTPIMSTYLVAVFVGYFDFVEGKSQEGIPVKIYTPLGKKDQGKFALDLTIKSLSFFSNYFGVPYPLPKQDSIVVNDMNKLYVDSWGMTEFVESYILDDPVDSSERSRRDAAIAICNEVAHQWIGNLVSIDWWSDLLMKEGFAQFLQYLCVDNAIPDYNILSYFMSSSFLYTMGLDAYPSTHAIEVVINDPSEIDLAFDNISYGKGAALVRMVRNFMGDESFRKALTLYLNKYKYGSVVTDNVWTIMEQTSSKPITKIMHTWTKQKGFPLVVVESATQETNNVRKLVLSQKKFSADPNFKGDNTLWMIPLLFSKQSKSNDVCYSTLLEGQQMTVSIPEVPEKDWVKVNTQGAVFLRTKYPKDILDKFLPSIQDKSMPALDRMTILDDLYALTKCGQTSTVDFLNMLAHMVDEDDSEIWYNIDGYFPEIINLLLDTDFLPSLYKYGIEIIKNIRNKVGYDVKPDDKRLTPILRWMVLDLLFRFEDQDFIQVSLKRFNDHVSGASILASSIRAVTYRAALSADGQRAFEGIQKIFRTAKSQIDKDRVMYSLVGLKDAKLVDPILQFCLSNEATQADFFNGIVAVARSKGGREATFEFIKKNYDSIRKKIDDNVSFWTVIKISTENFTKEEKIKEIQDFFASKNVNISNITQVQESFESIRINAAWLKRDGEIIKNYLSNFKPANSH